MIKAGETSACPLDFSHSVTGNGSVVKYLVTSVDHDMGSTKEVGDCAGVGVEETLSCDRDTFTTPVDLNELGKLALPTISAMGERGTRRASGSRWDP